MTILKVTSEVASLIYNASTSLIRFLYVRSSLQSNIQEVYKRNQFTIMFVVIGEGINVINLLSAIYYRDLFSISEYFDDQTSGLSLNYL